MIEYLGDVEDERLVPVESAVGCDTVVVLPGPAACSMLEAIFMASWMVATGAPRCRETVTDRTNGRLVAMRGARLVTAPNALARMGTAFRERLMARFSTARVNARILVVLHECFE